MPSKRPPKKTAPPTDLKRRKQPSTPDRTFEYWDEATMESARPLSIDVGPEGEPTDSSEEKERGREPE